MTCIVCFSIVNKYTYKQFIVDEIGMKMRIITCFGDRTKSVTFFIIVTYNSISVFNGVRSPLEFSNRCVLHYFLTIPVGFNYGSSLPLLTDHPISKFSGL